MFLKIGRKDTPLDPDAGNVEDQDHLDIGEYSDGLYRFVRSCDTPMTIGLQGEWGSGKTSLMKLVQGKLKKNDGEAVITFWFETWQYGAVGGADSLGMLLLRDLTEQLLASLEGDESIYKLRDQLSRAFRGTLPMAAGIAASMVTRNERLGEMATAATDAMMGRGGGQRSDVRACFRELVDKALLKKSGDHKRLVVFVDDLDRVPPVLAVRLLEVLKNFMDVQDCVFVVACDYEVVREGVAELMHMSAAQREGDKKEKVDAFFHKLFQVQFLMPVGQYSIDKLFRGYLSDKLKEHNERLKPKDITNFLENGTTTGQASGVRADGWFKLLLQVVEAAVGTNPRAFKRYLNLIDLTTCVDQSFRVKKKELAHWKIGDSKGDLATLRWCTALFPIVALQSRWSEVAVAWLLDAAEVNEASQLSNFETRLRTIIDRWRESGQSDGSREVIETQMEDEYFRQELRNVFRYDIRDKSVPADVESKYEMLRDFANNWFDLLNNSSANDDKLEDAELSVIAAWSERLGSMGTAKVQLRGIAKLRQECIKVDPIAGDGFVGLAAHALGRMTGDDTPTFVGGTPGSTSPWFFVRLGKRTGTLMSFERKLQVKINATPYYQDRWKLDGLAEAGQRLADRCVEAGVAPVNVQLRGTSWYFEFAQGHTAGRNAKLKEAFTSFIDEVDSLARHANVRETQPVGGTESDGVEHPESNGMGQEAPAL